MPLYHKKELFAFLEEIGEKPKKGLSQNFIVDRHVVEKVIEKSALVATDRVLEIGPGPGVLTEALLASGVQVVAVEKDPKFAKSLPRLGPVEVHLADVLTFDLQALGANKVVANLPFQITTPILEKLFFCREPFDVLILIVQREVGERMRASSGSKIYGALSVFTQMYTCPKSLSVISPHAFFPPPKVESALLVLEIKKSIPLLDQKAFSRFVKQLFSMRRKTLRAILKKQFDLEVKDKDVGKRRPESLALEEFIALYEEVVCS